MSLKTPRPRIILDHLNKLPYPLLFALWGSTILIFAGIYTILSYFPGNGPTGLDTFAPLPRFANALYYSVITATNTGYGDIVPLGISRFFAGFQSITELFLFALFVSKLVSNRQDIALQEVHKLSFELTFHNIREDFYVARKDFDLIVESAQKNRTLNESEWERLTIAYQHITSLLNEIPNFYDVTSDLYIIDPRREVLLLEAVSRTTTRVSHLIEIFRKANIDWREHPTSLTELQELLRTLDTLIPVWSEHSHDQSHDAFMTISRAQEELRDHLRYIS